MLADNRSAICSLISFDGMKSSAQRIDTSRFLLDCQYRVKQSDLCVSDKMLALHLDPLVALGGKSDALWKVGSHESLLPRLHGDVHMVRGQLPQVTITAAGTQSHEPLLVVVVFVVTSKVGL